MRTTIARAIALGVAVVATAACGSNGDQGTAPLNNRPTTTAVAHEEPTTSVAPPTTTAATTATTAMTAMTRVREVLSGSSRLRIDGIGPITVGMSLDEAHVAVGVPLAPNVGPFCTSLSTPQAPGVTLVATGSRTSSVDAIVVTQSSPVETVSGIGIGTNEAELFVAYGHQLRVVNSAMPSHRVIYHANDPALSDRSLVLMVRDGRVNAMYAGLRGAVEADEMCA